MRTLKRLSRAFGSSHSASSAYQKWPTWHTNSATWAGSSDVKRAGLLTHLKFENRLSKRGAQTPLIIRFTG